MTETNVKHLTDSEFETFVANTDKPVLVDFWAPWCAPCRMLGPVLEELAAEYGDRVTVAKVDVDQNPASAQRFRVVSIPTVKLFKGGQEVFSQSGAAPKAFWKDVVDHYA